MYFNLGFEASGTRSPHILRYIVRTGILAFVKRPLLYEHFKVE